MVGFEAEYLDGLGRAVARRRRGDKVLVLFLGSSIGNFDRQPGEVFLRKIREALEPGDALLLGTDLEKPLAQLIAAYDDSLGVTAEFNRNLLARINRDLGGDFDLSRFEHVALYNARERRIEMHLRSVEAQTVNIRDAHFRTTFRRDETIWTRVVINTAGTSRWKWLNAPGSNARSNGGRGMGLCRKPVGCRLAGARQPFRYLANSALGREETAEERKFIPVPRWS